MLSGAWDFRSLFAIWSLEILNQFLVFGLIVAQGEFSLNWVFGLTILRVYVPSLLWLSGLLSPAYHLPFATSNEFSGRVCIYWAGLFVARGFVAIPLLFAIWSLYLLLGLKEGGWVGNTGQLPSAPGNTIPFDNYRCPPLFLLELGSPGILIGPCRWLNLPSSL